MSLDVDWILFDFGGCLDSDGIHSRKLFFDQFVKLSLVNERDNSLFQEAYSYSDQKVINESLIVNSKLFHMNERMCFFIAEKLKIENLSKVEDVARAITDVQAKYLRRNKAIIEALEKKYKLGIISNFSGNLHLILEEFSLQSYFTFVLDSYHVKASKPDPAIFKLAISKCQIEAHRICFIGDNIDRDVLPAKKLGMKTILIHPNLKESEASYTVSTLESLLDINQIK